MVEGEAGPVEDAGDRADEEEVQLDRVLTRTEGGTVWVRSTLERSNDEQDEESRASIGEGGSGDLIDAGSGE